MNLTDRAYRSAVAPKIEHTVLTSTGRESWPLPQVQEVLRRIEAKEKVSYSFVVQMNWLPDRPRGWGPVESTLPTDSQFTLVQRPLTQGEADFIVEFIEGRYDFRPASECTAAKKLRSPKRAKYIVQSALRNLFGLKAVRVLDPFEVKSRGKTEEPLYRYRPGRDWLVLFEEVARAAEGSVVPAEPGKSEGAQAADSNDRIEQVPDTRESVPHVPAPRTRPRVARRPQRQSSVHVELESAWDLGEGSIDVELLSRNTVTAGNALSKFVSSVDDKPLPNRGYIWPKAGAIERFWFPETELQVGPRESARATVRFDLPQGLHFPNGALVALRAEDIDGKIVESKTRLSVARQVQETRSSVASPDSTPATR